MAQQLGQVAVESIVKIKENGSPVNFYVAKHDYESEWNGSGRTLLVRTADCSDALEFNASGRDGNDFRTSAILSWLNNTYKSRLDPKIQSFIKSTKYHQLVLYDDDAGTFDTVQFQSAIFLVSSEEVNKRNDNKLPIANKLLSRSGISWTRSPTTNSTYASAMSDGKTIRKTVSDDCAASPCFTLPATLFVDNDGNVVDIPDPPTLTVPQMVMQGQQATISWSAIEGADSYTRQRKSSADADWTQVYSGADLSYTETVGTWTSLQYRVQAVFDGTPGGWATSDPIQIVSASALVISGQDGDLGTLVNDVPYSISSDQTSPTIDVTVEVNGGEYASFQATSGQTYKVGVLDLPTGTGAIVITASTTVSESPVTVTRTWTYSKTAQTFPNSGSVATLTQEGNVVYPETLTEAVRASMTPWGGNLSTALNLLKNAALFNRTKQPKYSEVTIDLSTLTQTDAQNGKIINLPYKGAMTPHRVVHIGNPDSGIYDSSCNGVWLLRQDIVEMGDWQASNVSTGFPNSTIANAMDDYVDDYDISVQSSIKSVNIPYCVGGGSLSVTTTTKKIFPPSMKELGFDEENFPEDGAPLQYFISNPDADAVIANYNNAPANYWSRTTDNRFSTWIYHVTTWGVAGGDPAGNSQGYRPMFIMDPAFSATYYVDQNGGIHDQQEYTEAGDWLDVWGNAIPAVKLETGSYVGTGTYGSGSPNTLTFGFEPHVVIVAGMSNSNPGTSGDNYVEVGFFFPDILQEAYKASSYFLIGSSISQYSCAKFEYATNTLSWYYYTSGASDQLNYSGKTYCYIAIG